MTPAGNSADLVASILSRLRRAGLACLLFGGWAEEAIGLRLPGPHGDIDLLHVGPGFAGLDAFLAGSEELTPRPAKCFAHKRAFLIGDVLCEVILVEMQVGLPVTRFWGDVDFAWHHPLAEPEPVYLDGHALACASRANLLAYRHRHAETQPWRWRAAESRVAPFSS
ncbi:hypothetical protein BJF93_02685 [Xaviernesmea oryzae]|uniref:Uncharacterized protein n=1 Tax=Xaviernesmea oryzae TaxID=464029 RepID=A0A1Q9AZ71_9HYPH|nr:hypothetical protein [Xaviernesmea oryzae]OLP60990.1 hypothetical protein BJF93_02685 [Xaviernesmea oryzae]SEL18556.1 hypothetical protein SAMN04487976_106172 [Xaviernesmea oryzae]